MPISDDYSRIACLDIKIKRDKRQRREFNTKDLEDSISRLGVLKPIIVQRDLTLVAGERRLTASLKLALDTIPVRYIDEVDAEELQIVELEENLKREDLNWKDQVLATDRIHRAYTSRNAGSWTESQTALELSLSPNHVSRLLRLADNMGDSRISAQATLANAISCLQRIQGRREQEAMSMILEGGQGLLDAALSNVDEAKVVAPQDAPALPATDGHETPMTQGQTPEIQPRAPVPGAAFKQGVLAAVATTAARPDPAKTAQNAPPENLICADFLEWAKTYDGPRFNFLHCDFPYGVGLFDGARLSADHAYEDTKDVYFGLIEGLCANLDRLLSPNAHIMFWFSMDYYARTIALFRKLAPDIQFLPKPLIWVKSDNAGLLADRNRGPRHIYETALMGIRGERFVAKAVSDAYSAPTERSLHPSTKPEPVLKHFFQMFVDSGTSMLDPTAGSAASLRAAESMGALKTFGLEKDPSTHGAALGALHKARALRESAKKQADLGV